MVKAAPHLKKRPAGRADSEQLGDASGGNDATKMQKWQLLFLEPGPHLDFVVDLQDASFLEGSDLANLCAGIFLLTRNLNLQTPQSHCMYSARAAIIITIIITISIVIVIVIVVSIIRIYGLSPGLGTSPRGLTCTQGSQSNL